MKKTVKTYKTSEIFTALYGREAYEAWKAREAEIDRLMGDYKHYRKADIVDMREANYRQMKAAGERRLSKGVTSPLGTLPCAA